MNLESTITGKAWQKVGMHHHHGMNIPLASIHTKQSCGIGEYLDLLPLIDYLASIKFDVLQLLPLNDSGLDHSPYSALSSTALHPIYLSLHALPHQSRELKLELKTFKSLNASQKIPYLRVLNEKIRWLKKYFSEAKETIQSDPDFQTFLENNDWVQDYALFKVLKERNHNQSWKKWKEEEKNLSKTARRKLLQNYAERASFHITLQFLCHQQLKQVKLRAEEKQVFLMGDIPILVSPNSADVWQRQDFFDLDQTAGSPPNSFDPKGQIWNLPLYNWKALEEDHFEWWRKRMQSASKYYDIYRIDHIIGFFRIWATSIGEKPETGSFIPNDPALMEAQGRKLLKTLIGFTEMLPIGEDLGDPPPFINKCMEEYGIPGLKIFRYNRNWKTDQSFIPYAHYPPLTQCSVSTHDLETVQLWWENNPQDATAYAAFKKWTYSPKLSPKNQFEILWDNHHCGSLFHINLLQEYLALVPELTWEDPEEERINYPGTKSTRNWSYRYKEPLEVLLKNEKLKNLFEKLLQNV